MLRHKRLVDVDARNRNSVHQNEEEAAAAEKRRLSSGLRSGQHLASKQQQQAAATRQSHRYQARSNDEDDGNTTTEDNDDLEYRWRQAAQMLTDDDEIQLFAAESRHNEASTGERHTRFAQQDGRVHNYGQSQSARSRPDSASPSKGTTTTTEQEEDDEDDNSSISFAQSGCHSILSAWRLKAANRAPRAASRGRPTSVLSNASSAGRKSAASTQYTSARGKSPASQTRILLGPRAAQHFVTNTRRRRQANELILSTLEARRRLLALNRQNAASLFGSASYLADDTGSYVIERPSSRNENEPLLRNSSGVNAASGADDYAAAGVRLSLSPSPASGAGGAPKSPSPAPRGRPTLSDLGGGARSASVAAQAQRQRLLLSANARAKLEQAVANTQRNKRPPLARLDQNSSDLYSTNSSAESSSSESSSSQFTQLVTSELAPDCVLLDEQALKPRLLATTSASAPAASGASSNRASVAKLSTTTNRRSPPALPPKPIDSSPPRVPERSQKACNSTGGNRSPSKAAAAPMRQNDDEYDEEDEEEDESQTGKLRRGALRRDSIRRLRLNRSSMRGKQANSSTSSSSTDAAPSSSDSSSSNAAAAAAAKQALSKTRKLDIESNPFLNRHHFRTTSARSAALSPEVSSKRHISSGESSNRQQEETEVAKPAKQNKRSSWLFGLSSSQRNSTTAEATKTAQPSKLTPEARRSSSSEHIRDAGRSSHSHLQQANGNKKSKQEEDEVEIKRVERMLRQMRPNQVFASHARESSELSMMTSQQVAKQQQQQPTSGGRMVISRQTTTNTVPTSIRSNNSSATADGTNARMQQLAAESVDSQARRPASLPVRSVRESSKSRDDLKFDLAGNKREQKVEELWRHERTSAPNRETTSMTNHRMELIRSSSISPPPAFADDLQQQFATPSSPGSRFLSSSITALQQRPPAQQPPTSEPVARRSLSEARPAVAARRQPPVDSTGAAPIVPQRSTLSPTPPPLQPRQHLLPQQQPSAQVPKTMPKPKMATERQIVRPPAPQASPSASLPKFERTADDEFRKRVDYLRKLARANLASSDCTGTGSATASASQERRQSPPKTTTTTTTRPMSTNWRKSASMDTEQPQHRNPSVSPQLGPIEAYTRWNYSPERSTTAASTSRPKPAATNLDAMLASAGYQEREPEVPGFKWRRSNSSLASVSQPTVRRDEPTQGKTGSSTATREELEVQMQKSLSQEPTRQLTSSALVKLVVKEKSALKMDYAFVETKPHPPASVAQSASAQTTATTTTAQQPQKPDRATITQQQQQQPAQITRVAQQLPLGSAAVNQASQQIQIARSPLRVASPRSPDFGITAASSNDDSAIASSVSSPSLSFMMNPNGRSGDTQQTLRTPQLVGIRATTGGGRITEGGSSSSSGGLQSILRRQQQQQQLLQLSESPEEVLSQLSAVEPPVSAAVANMKRVHGASMSAQSQREPREPLFRSDTQPQEAGAGCRQATASPLVTTATVTTSSPPKRVHFNECTSIRSFESVSSLASDSTAVPNEILRQQVGSPDSMGSGSTSRLSAESPDFRKGSGAAIYAVRGDPELEPEVSAHHHHQQVAMQQQSQPYLIHQQGNQFMPQYSASGPMMVPQQPQQPPYIRMTAPPKITTLGPSCSPASAGHQQQQYLVRPSQMLASHILSSPVQAFQQPPQVLEDDDEPDYALRLRQAATSRVFSYVPPGMVQQQQQLHMQQPSPRHSQPMHLPAGGSPLPGAGQLQHQRHSQQQQQVSANRRLPKDLMNFQTEV